MMRSTTTRTRLAVTVLAFVLCATIWHWRHAAHGRTTTPPRSEWREATYPPGERATVDCATGFTLEYHPGYKIIRVLYPWRNARTSFTYVLIPRGAKRPPMPKGAVLVETPVRRVVLASTTYVPYFLTFGLTDRIVGMSGAHGAYSPVIGQLIQRGHIAEVSNGNGMARDYNMERLAAIQPDLVITYGTGLAQYDRQDQLEQAGFNVAIDAEYMEQTPLGQTEWMKFIAAFFDKDAEAERQFAQIMRNYKAEVALTTRVKNRPTVFCNASYKGVWYVPGGKSWPAAFLRDAGATYLWRDDPTVGSVPLNIEAVIERAKNADIWLEPGECRSLPELAAIDSRYSMFRAFRSGQVYNNNARVSARGANDIWETGVARPDRVLGDLISIIHPELVPGHKRVWYRQLSATAQAAQ